MRDYFMKDAAVKFLNFIDGDCVNSRDGEIIGEALMLPITVKASHGCEVYVNSILAKEVECGVYSVTVPLFGYRNTVVAENRTENTSSHIALFRMPNAEKKFRLSSDDNIVFLQDLTNNNYSSIFDQPYLAVYKKAHDLYGAKVHLNLFYCFDDEARAKFNNEREYFDLSMMTDRYKDEFRANSDWLKLAFHSNSEYPPSPYKSDSADVIRRDCIKVCREIIRFAGAECISNSTTTHYGAANLECVRALRSLGFRSLTGYFTFRSDGSPLVAYYANHELTEHVGARDFWVDTDVDMIFGRIDTVLNSGTLESTMGEVIKAATDPHRGGFVSIMIHEQYFYPQYRAYLADFEERVLGAVKYLYENGYRSAHITEATEERPLREYPAFN